MNQNSINKVSNFLSRQTISKDTLEAIQMSKGLSSGGPAKIELNNLNKRPTRGFIGTLSRNNIGQIHHHSA